MAEWVEKGSIKGPPGEIPDVSDFLRDGDVSSAISGSAEKVASDKAVKDYVDAQVSAEATSRQEQDSSLQTQIGGKANVEHSHEMDDVAGLNDKISEIETSVSGKANASHTHTIENVTGLQDALDEKADVGSMTLTSLGVTATSEELNYMDGVTSNVQTQLDGKANVEHDHEIVDVTGLQDALDSKASLAHTHSTSDVTGLDSALAGKSDNGHKHVSADVTDLNDKLDAKANVTHTHAIDDVTNLRTTLDGKAASKHSHATSDITGLDSKISEIEGDVAGKADSVHTHDAADVVSGTLAVDRVPSIPDSKIEGVSASKLVGTIPTGNLPSYVDDVIEADDYDSLPPTGEDGKIYVDKETNKTYRWGGSAYVEISASLALGETSATAFRGDYGQTAYQHAQSKGSEFATGFYKIATNAEGHVISATAVAKGDITALGVPAQDTTYVDATGSASGLMSASDKSKLDGIAEGADKLPDDGTEGQVLTKTADGVAWEDAASVDTSKLVNYNNSTKNLEKYLGGRIDCISIQSTTNNERMVTIGTEDSTAKISVMESNTSGVQISADIDTAKIVIDGTSNSFQIGDKSVTGITDDASNGSEWSLATAKAVKDYVDDHGMPSVVPINKGGTGVTTEDALVQKIFKSASTPKASATQYGVVKFASDADFKAYMGIS